MTDLDITLCQYPVVWEAPQENMERLFAALEKYFSSYVVNESTSALVVFPEMFLTGFTMNEAAAEAGDGPSHQWMQMVSSRFNVAVAGSLPILEGGKIYNRCFFIAPNGAEWHYDKCHLFSLGGEDEVYSAGKEFVVVHYMGWNIALSICYDLRFPVWMRNVEMKYDLMLNVASWPEPRIRVTEILSKARAIENLSFSAFANRIGEDSSNSYNGYSRIVNPRGEDIASSKSVDDFRFFNAVLSYSDLMTFRKKFPQWMDFDNFKLD